MNRGRPVRPVAVVVALVGLVALAAPTVGLAAPGQEHLPDDRAYELVSPPDKNGGDIMGDPTKIRAAVDGDAVAFTSFSAFGDAIGTGLVVEYMAVRGSGGWATHAITPPQEPTFGASIIVGQWPFYAGEFSDDLSKGVFRSFSPLTDAPNAAALRNLYVRDDLRTPGHGSYSLLSDPVAPLSQSFANKMWFSDASADFGHVLFEATLNLTADASGGDVKLYEWDHGVVRLAGVLPVSEGGGPATNAVAGRGSSGGQVEIGGGYANNTISDDGSRVYFTVPTAPGQPQGQLYLREDHATTVRINASEKATPDAAEPARFGTATPDGSTVFFTTAEQLTDDDDNARPDLYAYDADRPDSASDNLTRISVDAEPSDGIGAEVSGVIGATADGSHVYFTANDGQLAAGGPPLSGATDGIFLWQEGTIKFVGTFDVTSASTATGGASLISVGPTSARVSVDGSRLVFTAQDGSGLTGYDHGSTCGPQQNQPCQEVYVYDAEADGGAGALACASCNQAATTATSDASFQLFIGNGVSGPSTHLNHPLSADGSRVFFTTGERLLPGQDLNGGMPDVYQYDVDDGELHLISSGRSSAGSYFMDASRDGRDVFFVTRERLSGWDFDQGYDLYDARVEGGLPEPVPPPGTGCSGDACQGGVVSGVAGPIVPASSATPGSGSGARTSPRRFSLGRIGVVAKRRFARTGRLVLSVKTPAAGRIVVRSDRGPDSAVRVGGATTKRLTVRLSDAAQRRLRSRGRLRVRIVVRFANTSRTVLLTLGGGR